MDIGENFGEFRIEWYQVEVDRANSKGTVAILKFKKSPVSFQVPSHFWAGNYTFQILKTRHCYKCYLIIVYNIMYKKTKIIYTENEYIKLKVLITK